MARICACILLLHLGMMKINRFSSCSNITASAVIYIIIRPQNNTKIVFSVWPQFHRWPLLQVG